MAVPGEWSDRVTSEEPRHPTPDAPGASGVLTELSATAPPVLTELSATAPPGLTPMPFVQRWPTRPLPRPDAGRTRPRFLGAARPLAATLSANPLVLPPAPAASPPGNDTGNAPAAPDMDTPPAVADLATDIAPYQDRETVEPPREAGTTSDGTEVSNIRAGAQLLAEPTNQQVEELARRLYDPLVTRLRADLLIDRERRGHRTDLW
ncbi:MAG: hypothetical protein L0H79_19915 [Intrasporangium sp.]|uniref:hypothetical protein n=1 Tax=Intrasporangium sp. TaxID=1925024 RepID=UPI002648C91C|nr:hypothetical protein [Intrasporangium sp.]MDN5797992.1 hypothetical protein [Intrasporangium sp.]